MVKELALRGFEISKGDFFKGIYFSYKINDEGIESLCVRRNNSSISIKVDEGNIKSIYIDNKQKSIYLVEGDEKINETNFQQAQKIYEKVRKLLDIDNQIKNYVPKFSAESEINLYNVLNIENLSDLEKLIEEH